MSVRTLQPPAFESIDDPTRVPRILDSVLFWGLHAALVFAVLAFGGSQPWAVAVLEVASGLLFGIWAFRQYMDSEIHVPDNPLLFPIAGFAALVVAQLVLRRSAYPNATFHEAMRYVAYGVLFLVAQHCFQQPLMRRRSVQVLAGFGALVAIEAIVQNLTSPDAIYWHWRVPLSGSIYGPYASHGNYSGLMVMLVPVAIVLAINTRDASLKALLGFCSVLMAASIFLSHSRGGMISLTAEVLFLLFVAWTRNGNRRAMLIVLALMGGVAIAVVTLAPAELKSSVASLRDPLNPNVNGDRITIAKDSLRMFRAHPIMGWGLETFPVVYPEYRSFATTYYINEAHNDFAQALVETGLLGFAAMVIFLVLLYRVGLSNSRRGEGPMGATSATAALVGCTGFLVHGATDFNLHIPGNAAMFFVLCALATFSARVKRDGMKLYRMTDRREHFSNS